MLGERNVCFRFPKMYHNSPIYSNAEFKHFPGDNTPDHVLGERKICFCSPKMYHNSPTAMQNSEIFRRTIPQNFVLGGGGSLFSFSENVL